MIDKSGSIRNELFEQFSFCLTASFIEEVANRTGFSKEAVAQGVAGYMNEAVFAYELIHPHLSKEKSILEIGPGLPFLALFLSHKGYDFEVIDYQAGAFAPLSIASEMLLSHFSWRPSIYNVDISGDKLPRRSYEIIFSLNVLEHIANLDVACKNMESLLSPNGVMIHSCPNYSVPYEPHFGLALLPVFNSINRFIYSRSIEKNESLWDSLNFVTYRKMRACLSELNMEAHFHEGLMYKHLKRLLNETIFQERHKKIYILASFLFSFGLASLFKKIPPRLSTPMTFTARKIRISQISVD